MANVITPDSVNYLTARLESNQVIENALALTLSDVFTNNDEDERVPHIYSTGNTIAYLGGVAVATAGVDFGDEIARVPSSFGRLLLNYATNLRFPVSAAVNATNTVGSVIVTTQDNHIVILWGTDTSLVTDDLVYLDGIQFFTNLSG